MSKPFSAFYDHLLPELPGCTTKFVDIHLLQVARDFCNRTSAWRGTFPTITPEDETLTYFLVTPESKSEVVKPLTLTVDDELLWSASDPEDCDVRPKFEVDRPPFSINGDGDQITFTEQPAGDIVLYGSIRPAMNASSLPDMLLNDQLEAIRSGTLARLMAMGRKRWTDRDGATYYAMEYTRRCTAAAVKAQNSNTRKLLRTRKWG